MDNENGIRRNIQKDNQPKVQKIGVSWTRVETNSNTKGQGVAVTVTSSRFLLQILSFILRCCFV